MIKNPKEWINYHLYFVFAKAKLKPSKTRLKIYKIETAKKPKATDIAMLKTPGKKKAWLNIYFPILVVPV